MAGSSEPAIFISRHYLRSDYQLVAEAQARRELLIGRSSGLLPGGGNVPGAGDRLIYGPGYVYVPGHGILDEACNLPSSTCPNEYRDIR